MFRRKEKCQNMILVLQVPNIYKDILREEIDYISQGNLLSKQLHLPDFWQTQPASELQGFQSGRFVQDTELTLKLRCWILYQVSSNSPHDIHTISFFPIQLSNYQLFHFNPLFEVLIIPNGSLALPYHYYANKIC